MKKSILSLPKKSIYGVFLGDNIIGIGIKMDLREDRR